MASGKVSLFRVKCALTPANQPHAFGFLLRGYAGEIIGPARQEKGEEQSTASGRRIHDVVTRRAAVGFSDVAPASKKFSGGDRLANHLRKASQNQVTLLSFATAADASGRKGGRRVARDLRGTRSAAAAPAAVILRHSV